MLTDDYTTMFRLAKELKEAQDDIYKWIRLIKSGAEQKEYIPNMIDKIKKIDLLLTHYGLDQVKRM